MRNKTFWETFFYFFLCRIIASLFHNFSDSFLFQDRRDALKLLEIHLLVHEIQIVDNKWKQIQVFLRKIFQTFTKLVKTEPGSFDVQSICSASELQSSSFVQHHMIITSRPSAVLRNFVVFIYSFQKLPSRHVFNGYLSKLTLKRTIHTPVMIVDESPILVQSWKTVLKNSLSEFEIFTKQETCKIYIIYYHVTICWNGFLLL